MTTPQMNQQAQYEDAANHAYEKWVKDTPDYMDDWFEIFHPGFMAGIEAERERSKVLETALARIAKEKIRMPGNMNSPTGAARVAQEALSKYRGEHEQE
jgi:hypothetical protein